MADLISTTKLDILNQVQQHIETANTCFSSDDVNCNIVLLHLRQSQQSLNSIQQELEPDNFQAIDSTITSLITQVEYRINSQRLCASENAFAAERVNNGKTSFLKIV